jgi:acetoacetyl-CoA synthetase
VWHTVTHVPHNIYPANHRQTTVNLKKVELPVKQIVSGRIIKPSGTLANPDSLKYYEQFAQVEEVIDKLEKDRKETHISRL